MMLSLYRRDFHRQVAKRAKVGSFVGASLAKPATADRAHTGRVRATPAWLAWRLGGFLLLCAAPALAATNAPPEAAPSVTVTSGSALLIAPPPGGPASGSVTAEAHMIPAPPPTVYKAADGRCVRVFYQPAMNRAFAILWDDTSVELPQAVSASGARFSDGTWTVWNKGKSVMVLDEKAGRILFEGVEQPAAVAPTKVAGADAPPAPQSLVPGSKAWFAAVEAVVRVTDREGHGPDIGSEEWMGAVTKKVFRVHGEAVPVVATKAWFEQVNQRVFPGASATEKVAP